MERKDNSELIKMAMRNADEGVERQKFNRKAKREK